MTERSVDHVFIWSNKKIFTVEAVTSRQNDRMCARDVEDLPVGSCTQLRRMKPAKEMVWTAVASDGSKSPLVFIDKRYTLRSAPKYNYPTLGIF